MHVIGLPLLIAILASVASLTALGVAGVATGLIDRRGVAPFVFSWLRFAAFCAGVAILAGILSLFNRGLFT